MEIENIEDRATEKQLAVIRRLAKTQIDTASLTKRGASKLIEELIGKKDKKPDDKDLKCAFGLATKLVFSRYAEVGMDYKKPEFWTDVAEFYRQYLEHMAQVMNRA